MLSFEHLQFRYDPFPIGCASPAVDPETYKKMVDQFPSAELFDSFADLNKKGTKFTLSEKEDKTKFLKFVDSSPIWSEFHRWIKSDDFPYLLVDTLRQHNIELEFEHVSRLNRNIRSVRDFLRGRHRYRNPPLKARFEFSALPTIGGNLPPHTDAPTKVITLIVSMLKDDEWDTSIGGGTDVNKTKDPSNSFNYMNRMVDFDDVETIDTFDFRPNQVIVFVKTFNSWHSVRPMTGTVPDQLRKTLTINIETEY